MSRPESADLVRVDVSSRHPVVEFVLVDSAQRTVAGGPGRLCVDIAPGAYELRTTAGRFERTEVLTVRPGSPHVVGDVPLDVPTATPGAGHPHAVAAGNLSAGITDRLGGGAGLVLVLRGVAGSPPDPAHVEVLDEHLSRLTERADWQGDAAAGWAGWTGVGPPGGYVVRYRTGRPSDGWLEVPLWLQAGWQTVVFVPCDDGGPDPAAATVHLVPRGVTWTGHAVRDVLCQLLLWCLETGQGVPPFVLEEHVPDWRHDPMVALLAGAAMAATGGQEYARLLGEVDRLLPGHPDVAALRLGRSPRPAWTARLHWPPLLARLFSDAVLTADHAGMDVIEPGSTLDRIVPALVPDGPWLAWRGAHRPDFELVRERVRAYLGWSVRLPGSPAGHRLLAAATGLTTASVRRAVDDIQAQQSTQVLEWRARWRRRVGHILAAEDITLPVPGEIAVRGDPLSVVFRSEWEHRQSLARIFVEAPANVLSAAFRDGDPLLLHGPDRVGFLVELTGGGAVWRTGAAGPYRLRMPAMDLIGGRRAYLAVSVDPGAGQARTVSRQRTVVTAGQFELRTFQDHRHNVMLVARSRSRADAGTCVLVSVRNSFDGAESEVLAVPLSWLGSQDVAGGQLRVGKAGDGLSVFVVPALIPVEDIDEPVFRRSLILSANTTTRDAVRRALGAHAGR